MGLTEIFCQSMPEIKNLEKAAQRISQAIKNKERIILYGDADLDGTCSVIIMEETIQSLGGQISELYFVNRENQGYGLNKSALEHLKDKAPALLIVLDCGIGNIEEVELANQVGFEVIIVDHHIVLDKLPPASIIVDPKQKGDNYPFKELANVGITYRLSRALLEHKLKGMLNQSFLELVALATIADMMPQVEDNQILIEEGLSALAKTQRPGLQVFLDNYQGSEDLGEMKEIAQKITSVLNIAGFEDHLTKSYLVLTCDNKEKAKKLVGELIEKREEKQKKIEEMVNYIERGLESAEKASQPIIFEGKESWGLFLAGVVASRICRTYQKPTFVFKKGPQISKGSVRAPKGIDSVKAMSHCSELLTTFGGHPPASGFTIPTQNLEKFKKCLIEYFEQHGS